MRYLVTLVAVFMVARLACAEEISGTFMQESENLQVIYLDKKSGAERSRVAISIQRMQRDAGIFYQYTAHGKGNYDKYENITWEIEAEMQEKENFLYPLYSKRTIKDKDGNTINQSEKRFDYGKRQICFTILDAQGKIIKKELLPIKGKTVDSATMASFLKTFVANRAKREYRTFYLISEKLELFRITLTVIGEEKLELGSGKVAALKLKLTPSLGLLTGVVGAVVPPTYVWYAPNPPFNWLQYEGLETGLGTTHIIVHTNQEPGFLE